MSLAGHFAAAAAAAATAFINEKSTVSILPTLCRELLSRVSVGGGGSCCWFAARGAPKVSRKRNRPTAGFCLCVTNRETLLKIYARIAPGQRKKEINGQCNKRESYNGNNYCVCMRFCCWCDGERKKERERLTRETHNCLPVG